MAVKILEIHHTGVRIDNDAKLLNATQGESSPVTPPARSGASGNPKETQVAPRSVKRHNYL